MPYYGLYVPAKNGEVLRNGAHEIGSANINHEFINKNNAGNTPKNSTVTTEDFKSPFVFHAKKEALNSLKQHKDARLREFDTEDDAVKYAETGYEVVITKHPADKSAAAVSETNSQFRAPSRQELVFFRKLIEQGDYRQVKSMIWDNPRYLVGYGDTPTTLKEGYRYNAMHICAIYKQPKIAELLLQTVSDIKFVELLVGKKDDKICSELCRNLLDYYLNITEKGRNDTPLHFASKVGCVEMVELLTSYPQCKMQPNSENLYPKDVICSRAAGPDAKIKITNLLGERFYVPVLRSEDNTVPPQVGQPFSQHNPPDFKNDAFSPDMKIQALAGPMNADTAEKFCRRWKTPPRLGSDPSASPFNSSSFISPVKPSPRLANSTPRSIGTSPLAENTPNINCRRRMLFSCNPTAEEMEQQDTTDAVNCALMDHQNGNHIKVLHESNNIIINNNNNNNEQPETPRKIMQLNSIMLEKKKNLFFTYRDPNPASPIYKKSPSLNVSAEFNVERYTNTQYSDVSFDLFNSLRPETNDICLTPGFKERHIKITDPEKGLECIGRELARREFNVDWREYWDFLDAFVNIREQEGLQLLEAYFERRVNEQNSKQTDNKNAAMDKVCNALEQMSALGSWGFAMSSKNNKTQISNTPATVGNGKDEESYPQAKTKPYLCVEKSLQVFAKRITKVFLCNQSDAKPLNDLLMYELKRLKSLISSFKEDVRFQPVEFSKVHARISALVSYFVNASVDITPIVIKKIMHSITESLKKTELSDYYKCFCQNILISLGNAQPKAACDLPETEEDVCEKHWQLELSCDCDWEENLSRKTSRRNRFKNTQRGRTSSQEKHLTSNELNLQKTEQAATLIDADDEEEFWDCEGSDTCSDTVLDGNQSDSSDEAVFVTPTLGQSTDNLLESCENLEKQLFIYGNIPTKRDLDVLNAISDIELNAQTYPNIVAWKTAVLRYSKDEMAEFPTPTIVKKTHTPFLRNLTLPKDLNQVSPFMQQKSNATTVGIVTTTTYESVKQQPQQTLPLRKRLLMTPKLSTANINIFANSASSIPAAIMQSKQTH